MMHTNSTPDQGNNSFGSGSYSNPAMINHSNSISNSTTTNGGNNNLNLYPNRTRNSSDAFQSDDEELVPLGSSSAVVSAAASGGSGIPMLHPSSSPRRLSKVINLRYNRSAGSNVSIGSAGGDNYSRHIRSDGYGHLVKSTAASATAAATNTQSIESHNYEPDESEVWRAYVAQQHFKNRGQRWTTGKQRAIKRWLLTFAIGVTQAIVATLCNLVTRTLVRWKFDTVYRLLQGTATSTNTNVESANFYYYMGNNYNSNNYNLQQPRPFQAFIVFLLIQVLFSSISHLCAFIEPVCVGGGVLETKCYLNGIDLKNVVKFKTLICKVVGVAFSVSAGLPVGKEGPMFHIGAIVGAGMSQGRSFGGCSLHCCPCCRPSTSLIDTSFTKFSDFRNDREKRDFVSCGAAAGICSAFGAPIGGVLLSLEEGASYWSTKLTWRAFFCALVTLGTMLIIKNLGSSMGQLEIDKLFSLGDFTSLTSEASNFSLWELSLFMIVGCIGGLIGACFNAANEHLTRWRSKNVAISKTRKFVEVLIVSSFVTIVSFLLPLLWNRCTELPTDMQDWSNQEKNLVDALVPFQCIPGKEYNEVASLIFADADIAIKQLLHFREAGQGDSSSTFSSAALFLFFLPYIIMAVVTCGISLPMGLFVPSMISGAAFGRLYGHLLHKLDHTSGTFADSGTYALMGAASVLGGISRMTISFTVILLEATGDMQYVLPLMLTLMAARFTGNVFNDGLDDIKIRLRNIPFLDEDVPAIGERYEIVAGQVMSTDVKCLRPVEHAGIVYDLLRSCQHNCFPIVDTTSGGTLFGTASRSMLCTLLQRRAFGPPDVVLEEYDHSQGSCESLPPKRFSPLVQWDTIEREFPNYPQIQDVEMRPADRQCWLDLRPYANTAPFTVNETASIQRSYRLFRTLGLRHLCVVNYHNQLVGIITRKDLLPSALEDSLVRGKLASKKNRCIT
jgi:chloride channel 7